METITLYFNHILEQLFLFRSNTSLLSGGGETGIQVIRLSNSSVLCPVADQSWHCAACITLLNPCWDYLLFICLSIPRDGGLKRAKVKDTFREEQQKNYSKMIVGNGSLNSELD